MVSERQQTDRNTPLPTNAQSDRKTQIYDVAELLGQLLNGRFLIEKEIDRGGMGAVYLARDQQLHARPVVVKVLLDEAFKSEYVVQKFRQEIEALSRLDHPGIVGIMDAGELSNGRPYIVMQYVDGVSLRSVMTAEGMNLERCADLIRQIGRALAAAHARGIFHRDLKPDNIMLQQLGHGEEQIKIIDFGIAKVKNSIIAPSTALNISPGTVLYMAPEQLTGRPITPATDVYASGIIAYEMLTGRKPFNPDTGFELLQMQQRGVRVRPSDLRPSVSQTAEEIILKALAFEPNDRYQDVRDFADRLSRALTGHLEPTSLAEALPTPLAATALASEVTPLAQDRAIQAYSATPVAAPPIPVINPSASQLGLDSGSSAKTGSKFGLIALLVLLLLIIAGGAVGGGIWFVRSHNTANEKKSTDSSVVPTRVLTYKLRVQKMRDGRADGDPFDSLGQETFENGEKFRMEMSSPQSGYLYLLNEGPAGKGAITYNILFPAPSTKAGSPFVKENETVKTGWVVFDEHAGVEKFWMVWAAEPVKELEDVKKFANEKERGAISDETQSGAVRDFLMKSRSSKPQVEPDQDKKETKVTANVPTLVNLIKLEHR
jgi:serine/threonine protein kinase